MRQYATNHTNNKIIFPELSYLVMGILFEIHNKLGNKYQEKHYQRAIETKFKTAGIKFKREVPLKITFEGEELGEFKADFIIENKIILETKVIWKITPSDIKQVLRYLEAEGLHLGIIANFKHKLLEYRRIVR